MIFWKTARLVLFLLLLGLGSYLTGGAKPESFPEARAALGNGSSREAERTIFVGCDLSDEDQIAVTAGLAYGELRSVELNGGGESLRLSLVVARAYTRDFGRILQQHRRPSA